ncbi:MAG: YgiQ family radical SAM protein, partial [Deltaproteobacteria bacterium]|nr:YgiQ family radical SAM protein [Deltaproteobacteria bacterium]
MSPRKSRSRSSARRLTAFLPTSREEMEARGWDEIDVLLINGDAYVDHPAFGAALIGRHLEAQGLRVGMIAQPRWSEPDDLLRLGRPRLMVGVTAGNLDSMLNRLTAQNKIRSEDRYSPGGRPNQRPNRASIVYANLARRAFGGVPIVIGGIEASLRRVAHYDYWGDKVRRSVLLDAKADLLIFGMAERAVAEVADRLRQGEPVAEIRDVRGTAHVLRKGSWEQLEPSAHPRDGRVVLLPSYAEVSSDPRAFSRMSRLLAKEANPHNARPLLQPHGDEAVYLNPPALPLSTEELDQLYQLPFARAPHWSYREPVPAWDTVRTSVVTSRGCFGGCAFCSLSEHEGRQIQSRSTASVIREVSELARTADFGGTISDLGAPTANMYRMGCSDPVLQQACRRLSCLHPRICPHLRTDHGPLLRLLGKVRRTQGVKRAFIASGIRHDLAERSPAFVRALAEHHTGGQLSVAPEHSSPTVLAKMRKPPIDCYERFARAFREASAAA